MMRETRPSSRYRLGEFVAGFLAGWVTFGFVFVAIGWLW
jgi:hypothetical protein